VRREDSADGVLYKEVIYDEDHWELLRQKRGVAKRVMVPFVVRGFGPVVYGSVARGDVHEASDVEVFIPVPPNPALIEAIVESELGGWERRELVQATPAYVPKAYIYLDEKTTISFPLLKMMPEEESFYKTAGMVGYAGLLNGDRAPGMNKSLIVIVPTRAGHAEFPADRDPDLAARLIGVDPITIRNRVRVLTRRRIHGRTGVFRAISLAEGESFTSAFAELTSQNPILRRRLTR
jgi:predicted nucleotidyltransferase